MVRVVAISITHGDVLRHRPDHVVVVGSNVYAVYLVPVDVDAQGNAQPVGSEVSSPKVTP